MKWESRSHLTARVLMKNRICQLLSIQLSIGEQVLSIDPCYVRLTKVELLIGDATKAH